MATKPTPAILCAVLVLVGALAGCSSDAGSEATPSTTTASATPTPDPTPTPTPTPDPSTEPPATEEPTDALPPGFPDPATLIGLEAVDEQAADGTWTIVVGGTPIDLVKTFGTCFDGGTSNVCEYAIMGAVPPGANPQPATAGLLLLVRNAGTDAGGGVVWQVLDAVVALPPGGGAQYFQSCDGPPGVAIFTDPGAPLGATVPVSAAWGPDATITNLVELDPSSVTCQYVGD